jgi:tRNA threonylcarbamoyl adenosine modification protein (Sua5/YciO/YrdC/YwlC family)
LEGYLLSDDDIYLSTFVLKLGMFLSIHPQNPEPRKIEQVVDCLLKNGVIIYPTDAVYAIACDIRNPKAIEKLSKIRKIDARDALFSLACLDMSQASSFLLPINNKIFRAIKKNSPGPFTFILPANVTITKIFDKKRRTIGIRFPNNPIALAILKQLGSPLLTTSLHSETDELLEYYIDPEDIKVDYKHRVDLIIDGGLGGNMPSTLIDCSEENIEIIRYGRGVWKD